MKQGMPSIAPEIRYGIAAVRVKGWCGVGCDKERIDCEVDVHSDACQHEVCQGCPDADDQQDSDDDGVGHLPCFSPPETSQLLLDLDVVRTSVRDVERVHARFAEHQVSILQPIWQLPVSLEIPESVPARIEIGSRLIGLKSRGSTLQRP